MCYYNPRKIRFYGFPILRQNATNSLDLKPEQQCAVCPNPTFEFMFWRAGHGTTWPYFQAIKCLVIIGIVTAVYSLWLLYVDIEALKFFVFFLVSEAPLHCRVEALSCCRCCKDKKLSRAQLWYSVLVNCREWDFHAASSAFEEPLCEVC